MDADLRPVGIIGAGAIGVVVGEQIATGAIPGMTLAGFLCRSKRDALPGPQVESLGELLVPGAVVVEAAGHDAVREFAVDVLEAGVDFVCVSAGVLADRRLRARLSEASGRGGGRLLVASGAIAGLDLLCAAVSAGLDEVVIEQRKPPSTLLPEAEAKALEEPRVVFDGPVAEVVSRYPKTTNVAAAVALAGLGFERTRAVVVADPALRANQAFLRARGRFGTLQVQLDNVATANPGTSVIAAWSVVATLRTLGAPLFFAHV